MFTLCLQCFKSKRRFLWKQKHKPFECGGGVSLLIKLRSCFCFCLVTEIKSFIPLWHFSGLKKVVCGSNFGLTLQSRLICIQSEKSQPLVQFSAHRLTFDRDFSAPMKGILMARCLNISSRNSRNPFI